MNINYVPFVAFEAIQARAERTQKRLIIALTISACLLFASMVQRVKEPKIGNNV